MSSSIQPFKSSVSSGLGESQKFIGYSNPSVAFDFVKGKLRHISVKRNVATAAIGIMRLSNPAGSGVNILLLEFVVDASTDVEAVYVIDSTVTTPTVHTPWMPNRAYEGAGLPTIGVCQSGVGGYSGGTVVSRRRILAAAPADPRSFSVVLAPGQSVAVSTTTVGVMAHDLYAEALWADVGAP